MKKSSFRIVLLAALTVLLAMPSLSNAQSNILYGSSRNPLMNGANPAFFPSRSRVYLALPSVNLDLGSPLAISSIGQYDSAQNKTIINVNNLLDSLVSDRFRLGTNIHAFGLGIDFNRFFITLSSQVKISTALGIPQGIVTFLNEGNYGHVGDDVIELIDGQLVNATVYAEGALGFGYRITDNLTVGMRLKGLVGYLDLSNGGSSLTIRTEPDYSAMTANLDINMNLTAPGELVRDADSSVTGINFTNYVPKNYGFGLDLGARFSTDLFEVSASVIDLGPGIHWTEGIHRVVSAHKNNSFTFSGMDVSEAMHGGEVDTGFTRMLIDSLKTLMDYKVIDEGEDYQTPIPTKVNLGGMFHFNDYLSAGLLFHGEFERGLVKVDDIFKYKTIGFYSRTSVLARATVKDWIEVVAAVSMIQSKDKWDWFNPGVGVTLTPFKTLQFYFFLDYISNIYLIDAKQVNLSLGLNFLFGRSTNR